MIFFVTALSPSLLATLSHYNVKVLLLLIIDESGANSPLKYPSKVLFDQFIIFSGRTVL